MKKRIIEYFYNILKFHLMFVSNVLFLISLLLSLKVNKKYNYLYHYNYQLRLLAEFLSKDSCFKFSNFSFFNNRSDELHTFYCSLRNKNSLIFQIFSFFYSIIIEYYFEYALYIFIPYELNPKLGEILEQFFWELKKKMQYYSENNFNYQYLKNLEDYKRYEGYYIVYPKQYYINWFKFFFLETILNISYYLRYYLGLHKFKLIFEPIRKLENKIELYLEDFF